MRRTAPGKLKNGLRNVSTCGPPCCSRLSTVNVCNTVTTDQSVKHIPYEHDFQRMAWNPEGAQTVGDLPEPTSCLFHTKQRRQPRSELVHNSSSRSGSLADRMAFDLEDGTNAFDVEVAEEPSSKTRQIFSSACHYHSYELTPATSEIQHYLELVSALHKSIASVSSPM
jgi:hypothetical protein